MVISFPPALEVAIGEASRAVPSSQLMSAATSLSKHYRESLVSGAKPMVRGDLAALSYAVIIMPATYAQLTGAMRAVKQRIPGWQPASLLDIGSGPGTALWAAAEQWPALQAMTALEQEAAFIALGQRFARAGENPVLQKASWKKFAFKTNSLPKDDTRYDLVIIGHALNEMDEPLRRAVVSYAWERCSGLLLIVEPGTSAAFPLVKSMREYLLTLGAKTIAPCAHDRECPLVGDWCHFPQRLNRPAFQRRAKAGSAGWEESKFSYAAMARFSPDEAIWGRLIHQPNLQKGRVELTVSSREGIVHPQALKRNKAQYRLLSDYNWGDVIEQPIVPPAPE